MFIVYSIRYAEILLINAYKLINKNSKMSREMCRSLQLNYHVYLYASDEHPPVQLKLITFLKASQTGPEVQLK